MIKEGSMRSWDRQSPDTLSCAFVPLCHTSPSSLWKLPALHRKKAIRLPRRHASLTLHCTQTPLLHLHFTFTSPHSPSLLPTRPLLRSPPPSAPPIRPYFTFTFTSISKNFTYYISILTSNTSNNFTSTFGLTLARAVFNRYRTFTITSIDLIRYSPELTPHPLPLPPACRTSCT